MFVCFSALTAGIVVEGGPDAHGGGAALREVRAFRTVYSTSCRCRVTSQLAPARWQLQCTSYGSGKRDSLTYGGSPFGLTDPTTGGAPQCAPDQSAPGTIRNKWPTSAGSNGSAAWTLVEAPAGSL